MRSYRIGKTLKIRWGILTGGKSEPLSGRDLRLEIATGSRFRRNVPFEADDSVAEFLFQGSEQRYVGAYTLTMWENRGKENQTVVDRCDAFCLVACSCEESAESADEPNLDVETLELGSSNLETGVPGMSAYELFKRHNPDSALTEEEYAEAPVVEADRAAALADNPPKIVLNDQGYFWAFYDEDTKQYVVSEYPARGERERRETKATPVRRASKDRKESRENKALSVRKGLWVPKAREVPKVRRARRVTPEKRVRRAPRVTLQF